MVHSMRLAGWSGDYGLTDTIQIRAHPVDGMTYGFAEGFGMCGVCNVERLAH
jgi:hypothetical protein